MMHLWRVISTKLRDASRWLAIATIMLVSSSFLHGQARANSNTAQAVLRIHVVVMNVLSSPTPIQTTPAEKSVVYDLPMPKPRQETRTEQSKWQPSPANAHDKSSISNAVLITTTVLPE
jgi:hypothetical protein